MGRSVTCCRAAAWGLAVAVCAGLAGCGGEPPRARQAGPTAVTVVEAATRDVEVLQRAVGSVQAVGDVVITVEVAGIVDEVAFEEASLVEAGDVLVRLDDEEARAELDAARARRDRVRTEFETVSQLYERGAATEKEFRDARTALTESEAAVRVAEILLAKHTVRAPFAGRVGLRQVSEGAFVEPADPIASLVSVDPIEVRFAVPEGAVASLRAGLPLELRTPAYEGVPFRGLVHAVDARVDPATRTVSVLGRLANPEGRLRPGMFANVDLVLEVRRGAVVVPETAVITEGARQSVFTVRGGKAERRRVAIGQRRGGVVEVREGLDAGALVVTSNPNAIRDGADVAPRADETLAALGIDPEPFVSGLPAALRRAEAEPPRDAVAQ